jgi:hypothetical protein
MDVGSGLTQPGRGTARLQADCKRQPPDGQARGSRGRSLVVLVLLVANLLVANLLVAVVAVRVDVHDGLASFVPATGGGDGQRQPAENEGEPKAIFPYDSRQHAVDRSNERARRVKQSYATPSAPRGLRTHRFTASSSSPASTGFARCCW